MKDYLRQDGAALTFIYTASSYATGLFYEVYDLDTSEYLQGGAGVNSVTASLDYKITLNSDTTEYDRNLKIEYITTSPLGAYSEIQYISLVRPYATVDRIKELADIDTAVISDDDLKKLERRARLSINSHVGFDFYKKRISMEVYGNDTDVLTVHDNVLRVDYIYEDDLLIYDRYEEDNPIGYPITVAASKNRIKIYNTAEKNKEIYESPKFSIFEQGGVFKKDYVYKVEGLFGWEYVPADVEEATALLVDYYICNDFHIRNKNIAELTNDAYTLKYGPDAFYGTGNILVDNLLSNYREIKYMVI